MGCLVPANFEAGVFRGGFHPVGSGLEAGFLLCGETVLGYGQPNLGMADLEGVSKRSLDRGRCIESRKGEASAQPAEEVAEAVHGLLNPRHTIRCLTLGRHMSVAACMAHVELALANWALNHA